MKINAVDEQVIRTLGQYDSATVQNAGILVRGFVSEEDDYSGPALRCFLPEFGTLVGYAVTAEATPLHEPTQPGNWDEYYDAIAYADVPVMGVIVDADNPPGRGAIMGDGMAYRHVALGAVGVVTGGSVRDVAGIREAKCGLWGTGQVPGHGPFNMIRSGIPVEAGSLRINPGDILVGDADGITRVPVEIAADVAKMCAEVRQKESGMHRYFSAPDFTIEKYEEWKNGRS